MNRQFIEQEKRWRRKIDEIAPTIYAAFCVSLHRRYGFGYKRILRVLIDSQDLWHQAAQEGLDIIGLCSEETRIDMLSGMTAREMSIEGERI